MSRNYGNDQQKATKFALSINNQQNYGFNHIGNTNKTMGLRNGIPMDYLWIERTIWARGNDGRLGVQVSGVTWTLESMNSMGIVCAIVLGLSMVPCCGTYDGKFMAINPLCDCNCGILMNHF